MDNYIDPALILSEIRTDWEEFWIGDSTYQRTKNMLSKMVAFPYPDVQTPIVTSYLWTNPKFSSVLPILFCFGPPGSAKSNLAILASKLRESEPLNADNCTPVSLRNTCNQQKFLDEEKNYEADGALLILDNVQTATFKENRNLLALFLGGYKRGQDKVQIGALNGGNIEFYTFSSRIISSIQPLHLEWDLRELSSRCFLVPHSPLEKIQPETLKAQGFDIAEAIKPEDVNWKGFSKEYLKLWGEVANCMYFTQSKKSLRNTGGFSSRRWEMARDVLATGLLIEAWRGPKEAKECLSEYYAMIDSFDSEASPLEEILREDFLSHINGKGEFDNSMLMSFLNMKTSSNAFLERPKAKAVEDALNKLGWLKRKSKWRRME